MAHYLQRLKGMTLVQYLWIMLGGDFVLRARPYSADPAQYDNWFNLSFLIGVADGVIASAATTFYEDQGFTVEPRPTHDDYLVLNDGQPVKRFGIFSGVAAWRPKGTTDVRVIPMSSSTR